ncbi:hypothetical protein B6U99_04105 [Candidatus Geothermarchaeota archaeon ex4572_27]|nr:MAG: hypothetical protein B6U99_04105 [Candidatus Geothermarchaeota archaeon ex4572_27]
MGKTYETYASFETSERKWWEGKSLDHITPEDIKEPKEFTLTLVDTETMENFRARCLVTSDPNAIPDADILHVKDVQWGYSSAPRYTFYVKVLEVLPEPTVQIEYKRDKVRLSQIKGEIIKTLLERAKEKG